MLSTFTTLATIAEGAEATPALWNTQYAQIDRNFAAIATAFSNEAIINVKDPVYGAIGSGLVDDGPALARAVGALPSTGGIIYLPPGSYGITRDFIITKSNVKLMGAGAGVTTLKILTNWTTAPVVASVAALLNLIATGNTIGNEGIQIKNIEITGIRFLGIRPSTNPAIDPDLAPKAISSVFAHNVDIHHCIFEEICREVIWAAGTGTGPSSRWRITLNDFVNCGVLTNTSDQSCVNLNTDDSVVSFNTFRDVGSAAGLYARNCTCIGNSINGVYQWGIKIGEAVNQGDGGTISGNALRISANTTHEVRGIQVVGQAGGGGRHVSIVGNTVRLSSTTGHVQPKAILLGSATVGAAFGLRVIGNTVTVDMANIAATTTGIAVAGNGSKAEITDNTIEYLNANDTIYHAAFAATASAGLVMTTVISGNRVFGMGAVNGAAYDLTRTSTGTHVLVAEANVTDAGYFRFDNVQYTTGITNVPITFVSTSGASGVGTPYGPQTRGSTSVADGGTITHKLGSTPTRVLVTGTVASEFVSVTALGATTFTVAIKKDTGAAGTTQTVHWTAETLPS